MAKTDGRHRGLDVLHCVVDGEASRHATTGRVDVEIDVFGRVLGFEEKELGDDGGRCGLFDLAVEADDALFQEAREDVGWSAVSVDAFHWDVDWNELHVCQPPPTVSVTKGMGNAALGGLSGMALFMGGKAGKPEYGRAWRCAACRRMCDRVARRLDLAMNSMLMAFT